jgi:putative nucleotidyltransferase with HDIG domain
MGRADRAEGFAVARRLKVALAHTSEANDTRWRAAALLHDAGKQDSHFGTPGRVVATVVVMVAGDTRARGWSGSGEGARARIGRYAEHDRRGATQLREAGARPEVVAWAEAHHRPALWGDTGIPKAVCEALAAADGEPAP